MKFLATGGVCAIALVLCGCAGTPAKSGFVHQKTLDDNVDVVKVVSVNQWASARHATVVWLNYPTISTHAKPADG